MGAVKHSRQRDAIKTFLMSRKDHPTADVVYTFVKNDYPSISLGTVYRNLSFLVEHKDLEGAAKEILAQFKAYQAPQPKWGMAADQQGLVQQA